MRARASSGSAWNSSQVAPTHCSAGVVEVIDRLDALAARQALSELDLATLAACRARKGATCRAQPRAKTASFVS